ncbi:tetratricopeptide repeat-containing sensor histidine kinase [Psychroserpens sp. SPM9]|uniref:tetratricopeptide repeat-containing sensor histidine kinase n=1 Tax=Psychroserpens sp. SPM9 TaxID=2975598 RepID=UPI0021A5BFDC|nr:tetratricopeptide repeat-containing sensor histidine kinase [Psychroserpens sp. SPM9]MDG5490345.1 tetratricopeptide repeat protein [Psychroserpens sp. SPM9]
MKYTIRLFLILLFVTLGINVFGQNSTLDSILELRKLSKNKTLPIKDRLTYATNASQLSHDLGVDSTLLNSNRNLSYTYLISGDYEAFGSTSHSNLELALKLRDSIAIATTNSNLGWYYYQIEGDNIRSYDYYLRALKYYDALGDLKEKVEVLTGIATIQDDEKDYLGSEQNAIEVLKIINSVEENEGITLYEDKYICLNLLGIISLKLKNYDKSIEYNNQAFSITDKLQNGDYLQLQSKNNLAIAYRSKGNLEKALEIYEEILEEHDVLSEDLSFYSLIIVNRTFTEFLIGDYEFNNLESEFKRALKISDSVDDQYSELAASIDLAKFYKANDKKELAKKYAEISYNISRDIPINDLYLESMRILSQLTEGEESRSYLEHHIKLSDSLLTVERNVRNKFARIELETEQLEEANQKMSQQLIWLLAVSGGLVLTIILVYIIITQRAKNKELKFEQDQQKANEEIYNLMLSQQDKVDEARANEKKRISEELHDGVLGRLFGTRLSLDSLNFSEGKEAIQSRSAYIKELMTIENDIRKISHDLNTDFVSGSGFMDIVSELIEKQTMAYQLESSFDYTDDINWENVPNKTKINIYRIIQESLQNIYKHAKAKTVKISIQLKINVIWLSIIDDGHGFDVNKSKKGIGIKNINSRVNEVEGTAKFNSAINKGTEVNIMIPYKN